jgi:DHA1 family inner membrane transport protein
MNLPLLALFLAAFAVGTTDFIIAGMLPQVAADLHVTVASAGLLISGYAAGVALGGPVVAILTTELERRATLIGLMLVFIAGNVFCALSPSYGWLLAARVVIACTHGALLGYATVMATRLVAGDRQARAIAFVLSGLMIANIVGVPAGTALGAAYGWRTTFWAIAILGGVSTVGIAVLLPRGESGGEEKPGLASEFAVLARQEVYLSMLMIIGASLAYFVVFAYVAPLLIETAGVTQERLPLVLSLLGVGALVAILAGGRLADWKLMPSIIGMLVLQVVVALALPFVIHSPFVAGAALFVWSATGIALVAAPLQARILKGAHAAPNLAATLISSAFNIGISCGAALGASALVHGFGYDDLPWLGLVGVVPALLLAFVARSLDRRGGVAARPAPA